MFVFQKAFEHTAMTQLNKALSTSRWKSLNRNSYKAYGEDDIVNLQATKTWSFFNTTLKFYIIEVRGQYTVPWKWKINACKIWEKMYGFISFVFHYHSYKICKMKFYMEILFYKHSAILHLIWRQLMQNVCKNDCKIIERKISKTKPCIFSQVLHIR